MELVCICEHFFYLLIHIKYVFIVLKEKQNIVLSPQQWYCITLSAHKYLTHLTLHGLHE
jgi:hypothetical protein